MLCAVSWYSSWMDERMGGQHKLVVNCTNASGKINGIPQEAFRPNFETTFIRDQSMRAYFMEMVPLSVSLSLDQILMDQLWETH